jgi:hypothetical protein
MHPVDAVQILGQPAFHNTHPGITLLTGNWSRAVSFAGTNVAYQADITVRGMLESCEKHDTARLQRLLQVEFDGMTVTDMFEGSRRESIVENAFSVRWPKTQSSDPNGTVEAFQGVAAG